MRGKYRMEATAMVTLITGEKGTGKTKKLIQVANEAMERSMGNVVFIEKGTALTYDISHKIRLVDIEEYNVVGFEAFYGFIAGLCAGNYDLTDVIIDSTLKIGGRDLNALADFVENLNGLSERTSTNIVMTVSADESEFPPKIKMILNK